MGTTLGWGAEAVYFSVAAEADVGLEVDKAVNVYMLERRSDWREGPWLFGADAQPFVDRPTTPTRIGDMLIALVILKFLWHAKMVIG